MSSRNVCENNTKLCLLRQVQAIDIRFLREALQRRDLNDELSAPEKKDRVSYGTGPL